jgi:hypothetical protein
VAPQPNGSPCAADSECTSKQCVASPDGTQQVCCDKACGETCKTCTLNWATGFQGSPLGHDFTGTCVFVPVGDAWKCMSGQGCGTNGKCGAGGVNDTTTCSGNGNCISGHCGGQSNLCRRDKQPPGFPCRDGSDCSSGNCDANSFVCK